MDFSRSLRPSLPLWLLFLALCQSVTARVLHQKAYANWKGSNPGGSTDSFAYTAEASSVSQANGLYFLDDKAKLVKSGVLQNGGRPASYTYTGGTQALASLTKGEASQIFGTHVIAFTEQGARAVAGSGSAYTLTNGVHALSNNRMSYAPGNSIGDHSKSVAFTDRAGTSVSQVGTGYGATALATASTVAAFSRSEHVQEDKAPVTVGSRGPGDKTTKWWNRRSLLGAMVDSIIRGPLS